MTDEKLNAWICPVCKKPLYRKEKSYFCLNNHCFDIAKGGYVNLLMSSKTGNHGDDSLMVKSRTAFLNKGFYSKLAICLKDTVNSYFSTQKVILDAGCGEGYYTNIVSECDNSTVYAIDISKEAVHSACKRNASINFAVASCADIPLKDSSVNIILNIFSPLFCNEFKRILVDGGLLIRVVPGENHLIELKSAVYDKPYLNPKPDFELEGFEKEKICHLVYDINLEDNETIKELFMMTPYFYKTGKDDQKKLDLLSSLKTTVDFYLIVNKAIK